MCFSCSWVALLLFRWAHLFNKVFQFSKYVWFGEIDRSETACALLFVLVVDVNKRYWMMFPGHQHTVEVPTEVVEAHGNQMEHFTNKAGVQRNSDSSYHSAWFFIQLHYWNFSTFRTSSLQQTCNEWSHILGYWKSRGLLKDIFWFLIASSPALYLLGNRLGWLPGVSAACCTSLCPASKKLHPWNRIHPVPLRTYYPHCLQSASSHYLCHATLWMRIWWI